jgi:hypothetical protein
MKRAKTVRTESVQTDRLPGGEQIARGECLWRGSNSLCQIHTSGPFADTFSARLVDGVSYVSGEPDLPAGKQWRREKPAPELPGLSSLHGHPQRIGVEAVDGIRTTHYRFSTNWKSSMPNPEDSARTTPPRRWRAVIDVWIDAHHLVRRMLVTDPSQPSFQISTRFFDFGVAVPPIKAPPANKVTDHLTSPPPPPNSAPLPGLPSLPGLSQTVAPTTAPTQVPAP